MPFRQCEEVRRAYLSVIAETKQRFCVSFIDIIAQSPLEDGSRRLQVAELEQDITENAASHPRLRGPPFRFGFSKEDLSCFTRLAILATHEACQALRVEGDEARISSVRRSGEFAGARVGGAHFVGGKAFQPHRCMTIVGVQLQKSARNTCVFAPLPPCRSLRFFGDRDRPAEVGDRLFVGRAAQRVFARLAPPLDREIVEPGLGKMTGDSLGLFVSLDKRLRRAPVEGLAAALQEAVVCRVPDQRMLETVDRLWRDALDKEKVCLQETAQSDLEQAFIESLVAGFAKTGMARVDEGRMRSEVAQNHIGKAPPQHRPDLRDFAPRSQAVEACRKRLSQGRWDRLRAPLFAALEQQARYLLDEQRHAARALADALDHLR